MIGKDKVIHFFVCFILAVMVSALIKYAGVEEERAVAMGSLLAFLGGIGKELYDKYYKKTKFDWKDIAADFVGVVCALLAMMII